MSAPINSRLGATTSAGLAPLNSGRAPAASELSFVSAEAPSVALIDERRLVRECLASLLRRYAPDISVSSFSRVEEINLSNLSLAVIWIERGGAEGLSVATAKVTAIRQRLGQSPIAAFIESADPDLVRGVLKLSLNLIELKTTTKNIALASIRLALAGGRFTSSELLQSQFLKRDEVCASDKTDRGSAVGPIASPPPDFNALPNYDPRPRPRPLPPAPTASRLTRREVEILRRLNRGLQNKTIAFDLGISCCTVKVHIRNIMKKLNATNRTQVAFLARELLFETSVRNAAHGDSVDAFERKLSI